MSVNLVKEAAACFLEASQLGTSVQGSSTIGRYAPDFDKALANVDRIWQRAQDFYTQSSKELQPEERQFINTTFANTTGRLDQIRSKIQKYQARAKKFQGVEVQNSKIQEFLNS